MKLEDSTLKALQQKLIALRDIRQILKVIHEEFDLKKASDHDLSQMLFALGPSALGKMIERELEKDQSPDNLKRIGVLSHIRHHLLATCPSCPRKSRC